MKPIVISDPAAYKTGTLDELNVFCIEKYFPLTPVQESFTDSILATSEILTLDPQQSVALAICITFASK